MSPSPLVMLHGHMDGSSLGGCLTLVRVLAWHPYLGGCYPNGLVD
jgi:hypothetical protein